MEQQQQQYSGSRKMSKENIEGDDDTKIHDSSSQHRRKPKKIPNVPRQQTHLQYQLMSFKRLIGACKQKDLDNIREILNEQPELINQRDRYNRNLLHYTVILFRLKQESSSFSRTGGNQSSMDLGESDTDAADADDTIYDERRVSENLACFNYLLDRCQQKLWWQQDLDGLSLLHLAVISSNNPLVKYIIYEHPYSLEYPLVSTLDKEHHSPLHWAVITNNLECVKLLINSPSSAKLIHEPDFNGATPLHYATQTNDYPKYRRQLRLMLRNVASASNDDSEAIDQQRNGANDTGQKESGPQTDHHRRRQYLRKRKGHMMMSNSLEGSIGNLEVLETLIRSPYKVNIECREKDQRTPLLWAASSGNRDAILLLISAGANPHSCDLNKLGALHCAASHGFTECIEVLLTMSGVKSKQRLSSSSSSGQLSDSVNQADNLNCTPIFYAILSGNIDCVELLADRGSQLDWQDSKGRSGAHFAALKGQLNSLKLLHGRGANLWLANKQGDLPLHYAIKGGRHQVARWLLDNSPYENSVNAINNFGRAPIHLSIQRDDLEMLDYLIKRGANINQLVKVKDKSHHSNSILHQHHHSLENNRGESGGNFAKRTTSSEYHYETALDMAKRLGHDASVCLLQENGARAASEVMNGRINGRPLASGAAAVNVRSLFDLQSVEGPSPIGFDTSSSTSATSPHHQPAAIAREENVIGGSGLPELARPRPDSIPQSDSSGGGCGGGGSSALSQNSLTSIRDDSRNRPKVSHQHRQMTTNKALVGNSTASCVPDKPYKGGISYNNERINASIKCKLYDNQHTFPPYVAQSRNSRSNLKEDSKRQVVKSRHQSAPMGGQEIITNVNVYTSPCPLANHANSCTKCSHLPAGKSSTDCCPKLLAGSTTPSEGESEATSDGPATETSGDEADHHGQQLGHELPKLHNDLSRQPMTIRQTHQYMGGSKQQQQLGGGRLPPSQGHEQHLPVILSDREEVTTSGETSQDHSPEVAAGLEPQHYEVQRPAQFGGSCHSRSPTSEEPLRFDRADRGGHLTSNTPMQQRQNVRSPVAEYIRAPILSGQHNIEMSEDKQQYETEQNLHHQQHLYESHHLPDFSWVKPKVDSHRPPTSDRDSGFRSRSLSRQPATRKDRQDMMTVEPLSRSVSRQTFIKDQKRDSFELELGLERSIRKYKQEKRLFEELQGLKRSQIRSGRANEAVLVKRLVEHLRREQLAGSNDLLGMDSYSGPYTYKSYERFLYDQLRKLSQSNCAKLSKSMRDFEQELRASENFVDTQFVTIDNNEMSNNNNEELDADEERNYLEEDMQADLELRRVIEGSNLVSGGVLEKSAEKLESDLKGNEHTIERELVEYTQQTEENEQSHDLNKESAKNQQQDLEESNFFSMQEPKKESVRRSSVVSLSSSRRSSVDLERERFESVALANLATNQRASNHTDDDHDDDGDDESRSLVEDEANSICSAIMVDALGNLSSRSPIPSSLVDETAEGIEHNHDADAGEEKVEFGTESELTGARSRRRSVVNIGNKMEVIYHDVGIEIDPVGDPPTTDESLDEQEGSDSNISGSATSVEKQSGTKSRDRPSESTNIMENVKEEENENDSPDLSATSEQADQSEKPTEDAQELSSSNHEQAEDGKATIQPEVETGETTSRVQTAIRRASSPIERPKSPASQRRISSIDNSSRLNNATSYVSEIRKVFNGYDLDELHQQRRNQQASETESVVEANTEAAPIRRDSRQMSETRKKSQSRARRTKKQRSKIPGKKFIPQVDVEQIKQRWSRVKAVEKRGLMNEESSSKQKQQDSYLAKSQPNLKQVTSPERDGSKTNQETSNHVAEKQNYKLLYEINTRSKRERGDDTKNSAIWYRQRATRIVDVRCLKRTSSLPESVMYSNDLLKRFNVLKL